MSQDRHGRGASTDQQHEDNARAAEGRGWTLHTRPYRDDDRSASRYAKRERENFGRLISDLEDGSFGANVLVLWESSRGSRRTGEWVSLIELCEQAGVRIFVTTHDREYNPVNGRDRRSLLEDAVDSEYESSKAAERIQRSVRAAAADGRVHGKNLYGYKRVYDDRTRELVRIEEHPEQAPVVKEAARRVLGGETLYAIAKDFNARSLPPRRPSRSPHRQHLGWTPAAVKQMLTTTAYAGKRQHKGEIVADAQWPALIDPDVWATKLVPLLNDPSRKRTNDWPATHLLTGLAFCAECGASVRVGKQNKGSARRDENGVVLPREHYFSYLCIGVPGKTGFHVAIKEESLDLVVTELLLARLERPDFLATFGQPGDNTDERQALLDEIASHQQYLDEVREQAAARHDVSILFAQEDLIKPKIAEAQRRLERLTVADPLLLALVTSGDVRAAWERLVLAEKRRVIRAAMRPQIKPSQKRGARGIDMDRVVPGWVG
ncbi:recombinase family protein [Microbacterium esteraromaticum]|uniref:recombinase family protein n=1 Tax=Microbacterium esteraromaticum TaxID=57043 RepID=UPI001C96B6DD|nr:recombinase family protein [Microbacterium esteraromaticum]MBY6062220.1 recombinase family protein [Microbacterium esteraromaticum]